ncbi:hypothetical protein OROHE_007084 [Orobanche hederae]
MTYIKKTSKWIVWHFSSKLDVPSNVLQKKRVARILFFKIRPSQEILKIRDGTTLEKKRVARILVFKIRPYQEILKIRDDVPSNVLQKKRVARILFFKIWPSQKILKIRDGTPLEAEEILTYRKSPQNGSVWYFSSKLDIPSNVLQKKRVAHILVFKIRPSQDILKIRDGTPLEAEEILTYRKKPSKWIESTQEIHKIRDGTPLEKILKIRDEILKIRDDVPSNVLQKKRVARILFFKIWPSQKILKIRDGTPLEAEEILTYRKSPQNGSVWYFSSKLDIPSNVLQKKRVAHILVFKIRPSQDILKIRDGTPLEAEEILTYRKKPSKWIESTQEIHKIRDGTPLELDVPSKVLQKKRVARILVFKIRPSQEILKIRDGTPLEVEEILTYIKKTSKWIVWHFSSKLDVPSNVLQKKRVARILFFKIRPSQEILKIRDGTTLEAGEILTYRKKPSKWIEPSQDILKIRDEILKIRDELVWHFSIKLDVPSNVLQKKRVARILFFKIWPSQKILKIRDGTPLEAEEILTYRKSPQNGSVWYFSSKLDIPSNVLQKKRVAHILVFKIRPSQDILKIRDGTPLEAEEILTYRKKPSKWIESTQEIHKIRDGTPLEKKRLDVPSKVLQKKRVARILVFKIRPSQEILKIRDGTPLEVEEILTYIKKTSKWIVWHFSSKLDVPSNVLQKKRVARILFFKIRPSQEILKIRDGTTLEMPYQEILKIRDVLQKKRVAHILVFKIRPSQDILKIRDGTPLENKRVARILVFKIRPSQEILKIRDVAHILVFKIRPSQDILKIRDGTPLECNVLQKKRVAHILVFKIRPSQDILKIRDGTPLEAEEILTYIKKTSKWIVWHFSSKLDVPSNVLQKKRVARILFFKIRPSQEILKIRDGTPLEAEEILTYRKSPQNGSVWYFSSKLDIPSNVLQKKRVAHILVFKIRPSQDILKIRDGTPLEAEEILTYRKKPSKWIVARILVFKIRPSQEILKIRDDNKRVARILVFKIRPSQEILKIRDGTPLEVEEILTYIKKTSKWIVWHFSSKLDVPSNVLQKKRVARILFFKIRPSQEILKIRDGTTLEAGEILTYRKKPSKWIVARILVFKIWPSQKILKIRDGTPLEAEEILTYRKSPQNGSVWYFSSKLDIPSNVLQKKRVAHILVFKIRPSQDILKIRDGTPLEAEEILTYRKKPSKWIEMARILVFKIRPSQEILKIRDGTPLEMPSQDILKIRDE